MKHWLDGPPVTTDLKTHIVQQRSIQDVARFITPQWPDHLHDPFLLPDMEKAVARLKKAVSAKEKIGVVGDYDMDGTPGAVLLFQFLTLLGLATEVILPTRHDGYGFAPHYVKQLVEQGVSLIVTVDCGIRDFEAVETANKLKCDVIILDHHECDSRLPAALAVVNPKREDSTYPFRFLCGTGVAFKLVQALMQDQKISQSVPANWLAWSLDLVAMATIGDMVALVDENRLLAVYGLKVLQKGARLGLVRFLEAIKIDVRTVSYNDIAYKIVPKLNASGRLENMDDVFTLLSSNETKTIDSALKRILTRDTQRQLLTTSVLAQAKDKLNHDDLPPFVMVYDSSWHPGVTGLVASRLADELRRPVGVLGTLDGELYRGSMRGGGAVALPAVMQQAQDLIEKFGGHNEAAGLSVKKDNLEPLKQFLADFKSDADPIAAFQTDGTLQPDQIDGVSVEALEQLMPWGMGNQEPVWSLDTVQLHDIRWLGQNGDHLKATLVGTGNPVDMIYFGAQACRDLDLSQPVDIYGTVGINEFRGMRKPQLQVRGLALSKNSE